MAVSRIGVSNLITTAGGQPGAITVNANTVTGDLLVWFHYSRAAGGDETVNFPAGWNVIFDSVVAGNGLLAVAVKRRESSDGTYTSTITNHVPGESVLQFIETYRGAKLTIESNNVTPSLSTWSSKLQLGPVQPPTNTTIKPGDMVIIFAGRFENILTQLTLFDNISWSTGTLIDTELGLDAGAVTQFGLNDTGTNQTLTAKTISTTGTEEAGAGIMFIIEDDTKDIYPNRGSLTITGGTVDFIYNQQHRYWVAGGNGSWNSTTNWSDTSGGASGASVPTQDNAVFFDSNSGIGTVTVTSGAEALSFDATGFGGTILINNITLTLYGDITLGSTATYSTTTGTPVIRINSPGTTTLTSNGNTIPYRLILSGNSVTFTLADNWTVGDFYSDGSGSAGKTVNGNTIYVTRGIRTLSGAGTTTGTTTIEMIGNGSLYTTGGTIDLNIIINTTGTITIGASLTANIIAFSKNFTLTNGFVDTGLYNSTFNFINGASINGFANNPLYFVQFGGTNTINCDLYIEGIRGAGGATVNRTGNVAIYINSLLSGGGAQTRTYNIPLYITGGSVLWENFNGTIDAVEGLFIQCGVLYIGEIPGVRATNLNANTTFRGTLHYISGQVFVSANNNFIIGANSTLINTHRIAFNTITVNSGVQLTMNEFFSGLPERSTTVQSASSGARFTVNFTTSTPRYARFVNTIRMTLPNNTLIITTPQNRLTSNTNNQTTTNNDRQPNATILYSNTIANGAPLGLGNTYQMRALSNQLTHNDPSCFTSINKV